MRGKAFNIAEMQNTMGINVDLLQWSINLFNKKASGGSIKDENMSNNELAGRIT